MGKLRIEWDPNKESDLAGYKVQVDGGAFVDVGMPAINAAGKCEYTTPEMTLRDDLIAVKVLAYDTAGNESSPTEASFNPPPKAPTGLAVFFG